MVVVLPNTAGGSLEKRGERDEERGGKELGEKFRE